MRALGAGLAVVLLVTVAVAALPATAASPGVLLGSPFHGHLYRSWTYSIACGHMSFPSKFAFNKSSGAESESVRVSASTVGCVHHNALVQWGHTSVFQSKPVTVGGGFHVVSMVWNLSGFVSLSAVGTGLHAKHSPAGASAEGWLGVAFWVCDANANGSASSNCTIICNAPGGAFTACWEASWSASELRSNLSALHQAFSSPILAQGNLTTRSPVRWDFEAEVYYGISATATGANETASASLDLAGSSGGLRLVSLSAA